MCINLDLISVFKSLIAHFPTAYSLWDRHRFLWGGTGRILIIDKFGDTTGSFFKWTGLPFDQWAIGL